MSSAIKVIGAMLMLTLGATGCASAAAAGGAPSSGMRSSNYISGQELDDPSISGGSLIEAIRRLRPNFLPRGSGNLGGTTTEVEASIDGSPPAALSTLDHLRGSDVESVTLLKPADALQRFGMRPSDGPVLLVQLRKR
jgi:hypothetical protein